MSLLVQQVQSKCGLIALKSRVSCVAVGRSLDILFIYFCAFVCVSVCVYCFPRERIDVSFSSPASCVGVRLPGES